LNRLIQEGIEDPDIARHRVDFHGHFLWLPVGLSTSKTCAVTRGAMLKLSSGSETPGPERTEREGDVCSICLDDINEVFSTAQTPMVLHTARKSELCQERSSAKLTCKHIFHLDCIASEFNSKGVMVCPNCRKTEQGNWRCVEARRLRLQSSRRLIWLGGPVRYARSPTSPPVHVVEDAVLLEDQLLRHLFPNWSDRNAFDIDGDLRALERLDALDDLYRPPFTLPRLA
jgi:hypothetical protein